MPVKSLPRSLKELQKPQQSVVELQAQIDGLRGVLDSLKNIKPETPSPTNNLALKVEMADGELKGLYESLENVKQVIYQQGTVFDGSLGSVNSIIQAQAETLKTVRSVVDGLASRISIIKDGVDKIAGISVAEIRNLAPSIDKIGADVRNLAMVVREMLHMQMTPEQEPESEVEDCVVADSVRRDGAGRLVAVVYTYASGKKESKGGSNVR